MIDRGDLAGSIGRAHVERRYRGRLPLGGQT